MPRLPSTHAHRPEAVGGVAPTYASFWRRLGPGLPDAAHRPSADQVGQCPRHDDRIHANDLAPRRTHARVRLPRIRSEEHTSELQSLMRISYAVFCLKTKKRTTEHMQQIIANNKEVQLHNLQTTNTRPY